MSAVTSTNALAKDSTLQAVADAISTMGATSVGNLSALATTDKSSLVGAVNEVKNGLTELSGDFTTHHTTSLSGVGYYKCGRLVFVTLSSVTLSNGTLLGVPGAGNNVVLVLRDESAGGISQVLMDTSGIIASGAGSTSFTDGHSYSGTFMYVSAQ